MIWKDYGSMLGGTEPTTQSLITAFGSATTLYESMPGFKVGLAGRTAVPGAPFV